MNTDNLKGNRVLATVGSKEETLGQIKEEQAKQPQPKPVIASPQPSLFETPIPVPLAMKEAPANEQVVEEPKPTKKKKSKRLLLRGQTIATQATVPALPEPFTMHKTMNSPPPRYVP